MTQPSLFDLPAPSPAALGMARATAHAEAVHPDWPVLALAFLRAYAGTHATFCGWEVVAASREAKAVPEASGKAWGSIFRKAARLGVIRHSGTFEADPNRNANPCPVWVSKVGR